MRTFLKICSLGLIVVALFFYVLGVDAASTLPPNTLFKFKGTKVVYYVAGDAVAYPFPNEQVFLSWYPSFAKVKTYDRKDVLNTLSKTYVTIKPGARVVKFGSDPKLYAVTKGARLNWITNEKTVVELYGSSWRSYYVNLPASTISQYSISDRIEKSNQYSRSTQRSYNTITQELNRLNVLQKGFIDSEGNTVPLLKSLTENGSGVFSPAFSARTFSYSYNLKSTDERITFVPTAYADFMQIKINDYPVKSGGSVKLDIPGGKTEIPVVVSMPDGSKSNTYKILIDRGLPSANSRLISLSENLSRSLRPVFKSTVRDYDLFAGQDETSITIRAKQHVSSARVYIDGSEYTANTNYTKELKPGMNKITIQVIAQDGSASYYTITIEKPV